jgi:hypothetical protein
MNAAAGSGDAGGGLRVAEFGECLAAGCGNAHEQRLGAEPNDPHGVLSAEGSFPKHLEDIGGQNGHAPLVERCCGGQHGEGSRDRRE